MSVTYGFFNSVNGDRTYNADQMSEYFKGLVGNGVFENVGGGLQVLAANPNDMTVKVQPGRALIDCKWLESTAVETLTLRSYATYSYYVAVIIRLDYSTRTMAITTKNGVISTNPIRPTMTNTDTVKEICLAMVYLGKGVTSISQANIEDYRASSMCGWITGLIDQVDTSALFTQWQTAYRTYYNTMRSQFNEWFSALTEDLNVNTYVKRFESHWDSRTPSQVFAPTDYSYAAGDMFDVYINGLLAVVDEDYTLTISGTTVTVNFTNTFSSSVHIDMFATRSVIGFVQS